MNGDWHAAPPGRHSRRGRRCKLEGAFRKHRKIIKKLYYDDRKPLPEVIRILKQELAFPATATPKQFKTWIKAWNLRKNKSKSWSKPCPEDSSSSDLDGDYIPEEQFCADKIQEQPAQTPSIVKDLIPSNHNLREEPKFFCHVETFPHPDGPVLTPTCGSELRTYNESMTRKHVYEVWTQIPGQQGSSCNCDQDYRLMRPSFKVSISPFKSEVTIISEELLSELACPGLGLVATEGRFDVNVLRGNLTKLRMHLDKIKFYQYGTNAVFSRPELVREMALLVYEFLSKPKLLMLGAFSNACYERHLQRVREEEEKREYERKLQRAREERREYERGVLKVWEEMREAIDSKMRRAREEIREDGRNLQEEWEELLKDTDRKLKKATEERREYELNLQRAREERRGFEHLSPRAIEEIREEENNFKKEWKMMWEDLPKKRALQRAKEEKRSYDRKSLEQDEDIREYEYNFQAQWEEIWEELKNL